MKKKKSYRISETDYIKAVRRADREEEISVHGKPVRFAGGGLHKSKKTYDRSKYKQQIKEENYA